MKRKRRRQACFCSCPAPVCTVSSVCHLTASCALCSLVIQPLLPPTVVGTAEAPGRQSSPGSSAASHSRPSCTRAPQSCRQLWRACLGNPSCILHGVEPCLTWEAKAHDAGPCLPWTGKDREERRHHCGKAARCPSSAVVLRGTNNQMQLRPPPCRTHLHADPRGSLSSGAPQSRTTCSHHLGKSNAIERHPRTGRPCLTALPLRRPHTLQAMKAARRGTEWGHQRSQPPALYAKSTVQLLPRASWGEAWGGALVHLVVSRPEVPIQAHTLPRGRTAGVSMAWFRGRQGASLHHTSQMGQALMEGIQATRPCASPCWAAQPPNTHLSAPSSILRLGLQMCGS